MKAYLESLLERELPDGEGWHKVLCPFHDDHTPSASFSEENDAFKCFACDISASSTASLISRVEEIDLDEAQALAVGFTGKPKPKKTKVEGHLPFSNDTVRQRLNEAAAQYNEQVYQIADYLESRGITSEMARAAKLGYVTDPMLGHEQFTGRMSIPYITPTGVVSIRFRAIGDESPKYLQPSGEKTHVYNVTALHTATDTIAITEGEIDALILTHAIGIPAVGIPGASNWKHWYSRLFEDYPRIYVVGDGDKAGRDFSNKVVADIQEALPVAMPDGEDINSLFLSDESTLRSLFSKGR